MMALPSKHIKKRSPRVVDMPSQPFLIIVGALISQIVMPIIDSMIAEKNIAVGKVQAIQFI